ncbi:alkaline phosphatase [Caulobacter sp. 17J80-11]|uniref:alkaline phosphatase D family protein n=1 Tax=Caulobacter sp. 17J80-11 TaxID=2763502 RepID=UPI00165378A0|nr:alkaline phosphatase D family protein [Caulobacter sp. 17J80-11]MBC6982860.1 alkaline phosphatase D family protein [Caulobacter sp. 17J80-11]
MDKSGLSRRAFAAQAAALGAALAFGGTSAQAKVVARAERRDLYPQGVASGDPRPDSVILWTRRAPDDGVAAHRLTVEVASDPQFRKPVARGQVAVTAATDWTCRFLAAGLKPAREYWYRFVDEAGNTSRVGRTLTAPADGDDRPVRFAFVSCQDVTQGAMNAYRRMLHEDARRPREEQLGFVLHLGDFIYELVWYPEERPGGMERGRRLRDIVRYPNGEKVGAFHIPTDLDDYRTAYRGYLLDPDLQEARAQWPFVPVWDNHEFSWRAFQTQQPVGAEVRSAQKLKVAASQAWYEYQPARVRKPGSGDAFEAPSVANKPLGTLDARGLGQDPDNLAAINALQIKRAFRYGRNVDMILTDNRSFMSPGGDYSGLPQIKFGAMPEAMLEILDQASAYAGGSPPATIRVGELEFPNPHVKAPPEAYLGLEQMAWFKERLRAAKAPWKIWGHSFGTLTQRTDPQNLPAAFADQWPAGAGYGVLSGAYGVEHAEIFDMIRQEGITGFTVVAGDKHSFWAGYPSKTLPPRAFDPVGVEFITGSISAQGAAEVQQLTMPKDRPLRALYIHDKPDGSMECSLGMTLMHGVKSALLLQETGNADQARAARNPELAPHLKFVDHAGHGYTTVRASPDELETEFVCIPIPLERSATDDGGPLRYRVAHRVSLWKAGERPQLRQEILEGDPGLAV